MFPEKMNRKKFYPLEFGFWPIFPPPPDLIWVYWRDDKGLIINLQNQVQVMSNEGYILCQTFVTMSL